MESGDIVITHREHVLGSDRLKQTPAVYFGRLREPRPEPEIRQHVIRFASMLIILWYTIFVTPASLDKHNRTHTGERPFSCDVCDQRFTEKGALVRHKASKHEEGRPHCCHICGKTFKGEIRSDVTPGLTSLSVNTSRRTHWCVSSSSAREQLRVHLRRHKGMRKFECVDCGYKFTRQVRKHHSQHQLIWFSVTPTLPTRHLWSSSNGLSTLLSWLMITVFGP